MRNQHKFALSTMAVLALVLILPSDSLAQDDGYNVFCIAINEEETTKWVSSIFFFEDGNGYRRGAQPYGVKNAFLDHIKHKYGDTKFTFSDCKTYHVLERKLLNDSYRGEFDPRTGARRVIKTEWVFRD